MTKSIWNSLLLDPNSLSYFLQHIRGRVGLAFLVCIEAALSQPRPIQVSRKLLGMYSVRFPCSACDLETILKYLEVILEVQCYCAFHFLRVQRFSNYERLRSGYQENKIFTTYRDDLLESISLCGILTLVSNSLSSSVKHMSGIVTAIKTCYQGDEQVQSMNYIHHH